MSDYILKHTGAQIDEAVEKALNAPVISDDDITENSLWSSNKVSQEITTSHNDLLERIKALKDEIEGVAGIVVDDEQEGKEIVWSSTKVSSELEKNKVFVGDSVEDYYETGHSWIQINSTKEV